MAQTTNADAFGRPIESNIRMPVKQSDNSAVDKAMLNTTATLINLGQQADQAYAKKQLRSDINNTVQAFEQVSTYANGGTDDLFTQDDDVNKAIKAMTGKMDDVRMAVKQGVLLPELGKAQLEIALKEAKARRPGYADQLNAVASEVLGFNVSGYAANRLFNRQETKPELTEQQKLENKIYEDAVTTLYANGMGDAALGVPRKTAINTASQLKKASAQREQLLTEYELDKAEVGQVNQWTKQAAGEWGNSIVQQSLAGFSATLANAPKDPEARAEWMKQQVPTAVAALQELRNNLSTNFVSQVTAFQGPEAAAKLDPSIVNTALDPIVKNIDQMIEDFQSPGMLKTYTDALELDMTAKRSNFLDQSPTTKNYLALFTPDGRDAALLDNTVVGTLSKQQAGSSIAGEFRTWMGLDLGPNATKVDKQKQQLANKGFTEVVGAETPEEAASLFQSTWEAVKSTFGLDEKRPEKQQKASAATSYASKAVSLVDNIAQGRIPKENGPDTMDKVRTTVLSMMSLPEVQGTVAVADISSLYQQLNTPEMRMAENDYGVSMDDVRQLLRTKIQKDTNDIGSLYQSSVLKNKPIVQINGDNVPVNAIEGTNFVFDTRTMTSAATMNQKYIDSNIPRPDLSGAPATGGPSTQRPTFLGAGYNEAVSAFKSVADAYNNGKGITKNGKPVGNTKYSDGVGLLVGTTYQKLSDEGRINTKDTKSMFKDIDAAYEMVDTGIMKLTGVVPDDFESQIGTAYMALRRNSLDTSVNVDPAAYSVAMRMLRDPQVFRQVADLGGAVGPEQFSAVSRMYQAGLLRREVANGRISFR